MHNESMYNELRSGAGSFDEGSRLLFIGVDVEMVNELSKDFIAASATPLVLSILNQGDSYGYAIIQRVRELSDGELNWADGMLYPILHRLEKQKLIESYWGKAENGRDRKYYRLRKPGTVELVRLRANWQLIDAILRKTQEVRPCST